MNNGSGYISEEKVLTDRINIYLTSMMTMTTKVTFTLPAATISGADECFLVGEFNNWNPAEGIALKKQKDGSMKVKVELPAGNAYQYRYLLADGRWVNDDAEKIISHVYGQPVENCIVRVSEKLKKPAVKRSASAKPKTAAKAKATGEKKRTSKPKESKEK